MRILLVGNGGRDGFHDSIKHSGILTGSLNVTYRSGEFETRIVTTIRVQNLDVVIIDYHLTNIPDAIHAIIFCNATQEEESTVRNLYCDTIPIYKHKDGYSAMRTLERIIQHFKLDGMGEIGFFKEKSVPQNDEGWCASERREKVGFWTAMLMNSRF